MEDKNSPKNWGISNFHQSNLSCGLVFEGAGQYLLETIIEDFCKNAQVSADLARRLDLGK